MSKLNNDNKSPEEVNVPMTQEAFNRKYKLNPRIKQKPELRENGTLLSVRHLKHYFFFGKILKRSIRRKSEMLINILGFYLKNFICFV